MPDENGNIAEETNPVAQMTLSTLKEMNTNVFAIVYRQYS
jgi:hypothetical protein